MTARTLVVIGDSASASPDPAPRKDYALLVDALGADLLSKDGIRASGGRTALGMRLAYAAARRADEYDYLYCDSEHIGLPLAWLLAGRARRPRLTMLGHYLTPRKKRWLSRILRPQRATSTIVIHSEAQRRRACECGFAPGQVTDVPYQVDTSFWIPRDAERVHIASVGREFRDFPTLIEASKGGSVPVEIAAGSHWSARRIGIDQESLPPNVNIRRRTYGELRELYAASRFVVIPLHDVDFQAGIIAILEAMAMARAVIVSRTRGQTGTVRGKLFTEGGLVDIGEGSRGGDTGIYVTPGDSGALAGAIQYLSEHPDTAQAMGTAGRKAAEQCFSIETFVERMANIIVGSESPAGSTGE